MSYFKEKDNLSFHLTHLIRWLSFASLLCGIAAAQPVGENAIPVFTSPNPALSDSGYTKLVWSYSNHSVISEHIEFELQQSSSSDFQHPVVKYKGQDTATYISGLPTGTYFFRIRVNHHQEQRSGEWSETLPLTVQHHSLSLAFGLMAVGAVVFASTTALIVRGSTKAPPRLSK